MARVAAVGHEPTCDKRWPAALGTAAVAPRLLAQSGPVRIGYAIARTGPWAAGAQVSQEPNYLLWAEQVNAAPATEAVSVTGIQPHAAAETEKRPQ